MKIKELLTVWEKNMLLNDFQKSKTNNSYSVVFYLKKIVKYSKKRVKENKLFQQKIEANSLKRKTISFWAKLVLSNKIFKGFFVALLKELKDNLKNKRKHFAISVEKEEIVLIFFTSLIYSLKTLNFAKNTLFTEFKHNLKLHIIEKQKFQNKEKSPRFWTAKDSEKFRLEIERLVSACLYSAEKINIIKIEEAEVKKNQLFTIDIDLRTYLQAYKTFTDIKLPMIVKPSPWKYNSKYKVYMGGYLNNQYKKLTTLSPKTAHMVLNKDFLEAVNYQQNIPVRINKNYLNFLLEEDAFSVLLENNSSLERESISRYWKNQTNSLSIEQENIINEFCTIIYIAKSFMNFSKLWFPLNLDFRGRIYPVPSPLNYYHSEYLKGLFSFSELPLTKTEEEKWTKNFNESIYQSDGTISKSLIEERLDPFVRDFSKLKNWAEFSKKNKYGALALIKDLSNSMIGLDASASTFQIQGCLVLDEEMMFQTNLISNSREDIYAFLIKNFNNYLKQPNLCKEFSNEKYNVNYLPNYFHLINDHFKIKNMNIFFKKTDDFIKFLFFILHDRDLWKGIAMKMGYNQKAAHRSDEINDFIVLHYPRLKKHSAVRSFCFLLSLHFEEVFYKTFPKQKLLRQFLDLLVLERIKRQKKAIHFKIVSHEAIQAYPEEKIIDTYKRFNEKKFHFRTREKLENTLSLEKNKIACLPNFIQFLDSYLVCLMVNSSKKSNIPIKTIHDCFYVPFYHVYRIIPLYKDSLSEILTGNLLYKLLLDNELEGNKPLLDLLKKIGWNENYANDLKSVMDQNGKFILKL